MKKAGSVILSILFAFLLFQVLGLTIFKSSISFSTITDAISTVTSSLVGYEKHNNGLYYPDEWAGKKSLAAFEFDDLSLSGLEDLDITNMDINSIVMQILEENDVEVSQEFVTEILNSKETQSFLNKYTNNIVNYLTDSSSELKIDEKDVMNLVDNILDKYEEESGETVDRTEVKAAIAENIESVTDEIKNSLDEIKEESGFDLKLLKTLFNILSLKTLIISIIVCIVIAGAIFLINRNIFTMFKYISVPGIVDGAIYLVISLILIFVVPVVITLITPLMPESLLLFIGGLLKTVTKSVLITGAATFVISLILCIVSSNVLKKRVKTESKVE